MKTKLFRLNRGTSGVPILPQKDFTFEKFCKRVAISGLADWYSATSFCVKAFWLLAIISFAILLICSMSESIKEFYYSPIKTSISFIPVESMEFPEIYICPSNYIDYNLGNCRLDHIVWDLAWHININDPFGEAHDKWIKQLEQVFEWKTGRRKYNKTRGMKGAQRHDFFWPRDVRFKCPGSLYTGDELTILHLKDVLLNVSLKPLELVSGKFGGNWLSHTNISYFTRVLDKSYGICYKLKVNRHQIVRGSGLHITLNLHLNGRKKFGKPLDRTDQVVRAFSKYSGALVKIGNPVDPLDEGGFFAGAGQIVKANLGLINEKLVNVRYSATPQLCLEEMDYPSFKVLKGKYTLQRCAIDCFLQCVSASDSDCMLMLDDSELQPQYHNVKACSVDESNHAIRAVLKFNEGIYNCSSKCRMPCEKHRYTVDVSNMPYQGNEGKSVVDLRIAFGDLEYTTLVQSQATSAVQLISDIGGQAGLYLGASLFTVLQLVALLSAWCYKTGIKNKQPQEAVNESAYSGLDGFNSTRHMAGDGHSHGKNCHTLVELDRQEN